MFVGHANKGHDGFVGHSVLGRWVNLGAGTTTSNLKNTYGTVALWTPGGVADTGLQFLGTLFGDHVKTGIGLRLTTGCVLGAGANVVDRMPPKAVAPFAWGERRALRDLRQCEVSRDGGARDGAAAIVLDARMRGTCWRPTAGAGAPGDRRRRRRRRPVRPEPSMSHGAATCG